MNYLYKNRLKLTNRPGSHGIVHDKVGDCPVTMDIAKIRLRMIHVDTYNQIFTSMSRTELSSGRVLQNRLQTQTLLLQPLYIF